MSEKKDLKESYEVIHSPCAQNEISVSVVLVRPENGANVGSIARAMANFGVKSALTIVGSPPSIIDCESRRLAVHAGAILDNATFFKNLDQVFGGRSKILRLAATARIASSNRAHPLRVEQAIARAVEKAHAGELEEVFLVFGCESDGLSNDEVAACDLVASIPSSQQYRSINLAQAVVIFLYEWNRSWLLEAEKPVTVSRGQKQKLIAHFLILAEEVGFVLPGDPFKMRPRLESILSALPPHVPEVRTLHGLLDQISRSLKKGAPDVKGRFRHYWKNEDNELISGQEPLA